MQKIIKRYICVIAILSSIMGYTQCIKDSPDYTNCILLQAKKAFELAEEEAAKSKAREAIAVAENLIAVGLVQIDTKAQIQTLDAKILQANLEKSQAAKYEQDQARQALAQAQQKLDLAAQELNTALNIAAATAQIPNLGATHIAQASAADYTAQAVQHAQLASQQYAYATGQATSTNPSVPTWYMDYDNDGWHSVSQQKSTPPGAFGWKSTTKGIDCNDKDSTKTYDCSTAAPVIIPWFVDKDGDGYHGNAQGATTSPGPEWTSVMTRGPDCNDGVFSADNSVCNAPCTITITCSTGQTLNVAICACENCNTTETAKADKVTKLANITEAKTKILQLQSDAKTKADETNFSINTDNTGVNTTTAIAGGAGNTTAMTIGATTQVTAHAHSDNALRSLYAAHSPTDIYGLYDGYAAHNNYETSITVGLIDTYALIVEDAAAFAAFASSYTRTDCIKADDFVAKTDPSEDLEKAITTLMNQGETVDEAYASAMAYLLKEYNTGVGLYNSKIGADGATTFKKKKTTKSIITPAVPASGSTPAVPEKAKFTKKDC